MKKALVLAIVMVLGLGTLAFAGPLSGCWSSWLQVDPNATDLTCCFDFGSEINVDYTACGWSFGSTAIFSIDGFDNFFVEAEGVLGAFSFKSLLDFKPEVPTFVFWGNAASVSIAGIDLYVAGAVQNFNLTTQTPSDIGVGWQIGGQGTAGDCTISVNVNFGMADYSYYIWYYGYNWWLSTMAYESCGTWYKPGGAWEVQTSGCATAWSSANIYVEFPFTCLDVMLNASFSCENGFEAFNFELYNFDIGLGWLTLDEVDITFAIDEKTVGTWWGVTLGEALCVTPTITLEGTDTSISGITLNALMLEYSFNGVTFKAGEIFDNTWYGGKLSGAHTWGFTDTGGFSYKSGCVVDFAYNEFFGIEMDGDSCCGGAFDGYLYNFFIAGETGSFLGWQETLVGVEVGLGSTTSFSFDVALDSVGLETFTFGFEFCW